MTLSIRLPHYFPTEKGFKTLHAFPQHLICRTAGELFAEKDVVPKIPPETFQRRQSIMSQLRKMRPVDKCTRINTPMYSWLRDATTAKSPGAKTGICSLGVGGVTHGKRCQCEHLHHATVCCREAPSLNYMTAKETTDYREEILGQTHVLGRAANSWLPS